jgi:hypothetical protein
VEVVSVVADILVVIVVAVGALLWRSVGAGIEEGAKEQAKELVAELNRQTALARQLEQTRGTERQELRFESYGALWAQMRPLAIYDDRRIDRQAMRELSTALSDWYFSAKGGLMLTRHNRDLYFALQDLVSGVAALEPDWEAERVPRPRQVFEALLEHRGLVDALTLIEHLDTAAPTDWPGAGVEALAKEWRTSVVTLVTAWTELSAGERFAALQQVASVLRTGLSNDVESRLR